MEYFPPKWDSAFSIQWYASPKQQLQEEIMAKHYKQSPKDRKKESHGMKDYYKKYPSKESRAGHSANMSTSHRKAESRGMKRHNDEMHGYADNEMNRKGKEYYGMGYGEPSNLPQHPVHHTYPQPYPRLKSDYPDTIAEIDRDMIGDFENLASQPSDSKY